MELFKAFIAAAIAVGFIFLLWSYNQPKTEVFACNDLPKNAPADVRNLCKFKLR